MTKFNNSPINTNPEPTNGAHTRKEGRWSRMLLKKITRASIDRLTAIVSSTLFGEFDFRIDLVETVSTPQVKHVPVIKPAPEPVSAPSFVPKEVSPEAPKPEAMATAKDDQDGPEPAKVEKVKWATTTLLEQGDSIHSTLFECGGCSEKTAGRHMKAPLINPRGIIPSDEKIVEESQCKWCTPADGGWIAGIIKYASHARENKVAFATQLMNASLNGDPEKPHHVRRFYLRTHNRLARAEKAFAVYDRMIKGCSSLSTFESNEEAIKLLAQARAWFPSRREGVTKSATAVKRESTIRTRIQNGNLERAENTLKAARKDFPGFDWDTVEAELTAAKTKIDHSFKIDALKSAIIAALGQDDIDEMFALIDRGNQAYPEFNWDGFGEQVLNG